MVVDKEQIQEKLNVLYTEEMGEGIGQIFEYSNNDYGYEFRCTERDSPTTFQFMMKIAEVIGTTDFHVDKSQYSSGCDTCGYGAKWEHEITWRLKNE